MLSDTQTLVLLIVLFVLAAGTIAWAWRTRGQDGPETNPFVRPEKIGQRR